MKILFYNIQYCAGINQGGWRYPLSLWKYLFSGKTAMIKLKNFIKEVNADILAVDEIDSGSLRTLFHSQVEDMSANIYSSSFFDCKYSNFFRKIPVFQKQGNAIFSKQFFHCHSHRVSGGLKDLIIEMEINTGLSIFLVHLALGEKGQSKQLKQLSNILREKNKEAIVFGDFNSDLNDRHMVEFLEKNKLTSANINNLKTFPAWNPKREIDYFFVSSKIQINDFKVYQNVMSDHLPLLIDYTLQNVVS